MYQALYRKYRPAAFDDVVGQQAVTQTLKNQLLSGKLSHAYLFTGSRGTGKTSCARILAKAVNCLHPLDGNPCNCCDACKRIDSGDCMDIQEIDAASNNGVDNVRDLRDGAVYSPAEVKKRVYIIDEVHMLSQGAFNALLKIIEEPPDHVLFILATTELHKVPATILSRCQRFSFRRILPEDIAARLNYVAYQEGIDLTADASRLLARLADGALRDGMSLLDQCATASAGKTVDVDCVYNCLGLAGSRKTGEMLKYISEKNTEQLMCLFSALYTSGKDIPAMLDELSGLCRDLLLLKTAGDAALGMTSGICTEEEQKTLLPLFTAAELLRYIGILQETNAGLARSSNRRIDAELCLLRLCSPELDTDCAAMDARLSRVEEQLASGQLVFSGPEKSVTGTDIPANPAPPENLVLPVGFLPELTEKLRPVLDPGDTALFSSGLVTPKLENGRLVFLADTEWVLTRISLPEKLQLLSDKSSAILRCRVTAEAELKNASAVTENGLDGLLDIGKSFPGLISIQ